MYVCVRARVNIRSFEEHGKVAARGFENENQFLRARTNVFSTRSHIALFSPGRDKPRYGHCFTTLITIKVSATTYVNVHVPARKNSP